MATVQDYVNENEVIRFLQDLLRIHTQNPPGNELPAARYVGDFLAAFGFDLQYIASEPQRVSLVARLRGSGGGRSLIMNGHLDTGPIGTGWTKDPWGGEIEDGKN